MKKVFPIYIWALGILALIICMGGSCEFNQEAKQPLQEDKLQVVVTLSFLEDMVSNVGGEKLEVKGLVPVGVEPEHYEPTPGDIRAIENADLFIYNGLNMERWLPKIVSDLEERENYLALAESECFEIITLPSGPFKGNPDPHLWTNVQYASSYVQQIGALLIDAAPHHADYYAKNLEEYLRELEDLHIWMKEKLQKIPEEKRLLITSELCFQYFAKEYGFFHDAIWPINAPEEGTSRQITRILEVIDEHEIPVLFVENQVAPRPMRQVSREADVPIAGELYSDSLSKPGEGAETYLQMMQVNTKRIFDALK